MVAGHDRSAATLGDIAHVPRREIKDTTRCAAAIPFLLAVLASGDARAARTALERPRNRICRYGFVVDRATAATVRFLCDPAQHPEVTCRAQILDLLRSSAAARQWETTAAAHPKPRRHHGHDVASKDAARRAVHAHSGAIPRLLNEQEATEAGPGPKSQRGPGGAAGQARVDPHS
jgi:hypothetical protein